MRCACLAVSYTPRGWRRNQFSMRTWVRQANAIVSASYRGEYCEPRRLRKARLGKYGSECRSTKGFFRAISGYLLVGRLSRSQVYASNCRIWIATACLMFLIAFFLSPLRRCLWVCRNQRLEWRNREGRGEGMFRRLGSVLFGFCENLHCLSRQRWNVDRRREPFFAHPGLARRRLPITSSKS